MPLSRPKEPCGRRMLCERPQTKPRATSPCWRSKKPPVTPAMPLARRGNGDRVTLSGPAASSARDRRRVAELERTVGRQRMKILGRHRQGTKPMVRRRSPGSASYLQTLFHETVQRSIHRFHRRVEAQAGTDAGSCLWENSWENHHAEPVASLTIRGNPIRVAIPSHPRGGRAREREFPRPA